ncbi:ankyrin-3-like [Gigantopelta aegis]|uniref:ankyrin-3-like n=1 Tax=Gigantopelta aegis TaxID=1735272 RepID=UPI001B88E3D5|nr:ankyrin-3-like [Gigantopelta aegis]
MSAVSLYLLSKGADPNVTNKENISSLHLATEKCSLELLEKLIEKGANMNATDDHGNTPLHFGVKKNSIQIVMYLVEKGSKINLKNKSFITPLYEGVRLKSPKVAMYLLDKGADPNITDKEGNSPLHLAVDMEHIDLINELVTRGVNLEAVDSHGSNPFQRAIYHSSLQVVQCLAEKESMVHIPDTLGRTALHLAACGRRLGHPAAMDQRVIRFLLDAGCDINSEDKHGYTPLMYACSSGNCENVELLLEKGANPNGRDVTALHVAAGCHMPDILKLLLNKSGNRNVVSNSGDTLIHVAVRWDLRKTLYRDMYPLNLYGGTLPSTFWRECIDYLVSDFQCNMPEHILRMDVICLWLFTWPFMSSLIPLLEIENVLEVLLHSGCNINAKNKAGQTPVHVCIQYGECRNLEELLNRGADVSLVDNLGRSALYYAVSLVKPDAVQILLQFGAKDGETSYGVTACEKAHVKMQYSDDENIKAKCSKIIDILKYY